MGIRIYKPTSNGRRRASVFTFGELTGKSPHKKLMVIKKSIAGRNFTGKITINHRGGGVKRYYRLVDFKQDKFDIPAKVMSVEYDPNRTARIILLNYADGEKRYILAPLDVKIGDTIISSKNKIEIKTGNRMPLEYIPLGMLIHNVEMVPGKGGELARSAGSAVKLMAIEGGYAHLKMPSTEIRMVPKDCMATIGQVSNIEAMNRRLGKAGLMRKLGFKPTVLGKSKNPVDHPHGGGEGHQPIGLKHPKTPWGKPALGVKTRDKKLYSAKFIIERRKKKSRI